MAYPTRSPHAETRPSKASAEPDHGPDRHLITLGQLQQRLQLSRTMLYRLMRQHRLVPVRIGKAVRFEASSVDAFIDGLADQADVPSEPRRSYDRQR